MVLAVTTELFVDGAWSDITDDVRQDEPIAVGWGRADDAASPQPNTLKLMLNNLDGKYSPRHPLSPLFGKIGRNTPIRVRLGAKNGRLSLPGREDSYASTPDHASLDITGDIDIRAEVDPATWRPGADSMALARKYLTTGNQRSWTWRIGVLGHLRVSWSPDGTFGSVVTADSTIQVPEDSGRIAVRVTIDVDNGASGKDVKFYTAPTIDGAWTQLGATVTTVGVTSIHAGTAPLELGRLSPEGLAIDPFQGDVYAFELRSGIDGSSVVNPDFATLDAGATTFTDQAGRSWTVSGPAGITDPSVRFSGEVSSWPSRWQLSGNDAWVSIEASGIRRRLGQGASPLRSPLFRDISTRPSVVAYWPLEDGVDATSFAAGREGDTSVLSIQGLADLASFDEFIASGPLPTFKTPVSGSSSAESNVAFYTGATKQRFFTLVAVPSAGMPAIRRLFTLRTAGTTGTWGVEIDSGGFLRIVVRDFDDVLVLTTGFSGTSINGVPQMLSLLLTKAGQDIDYQLLRFIPGSSVGSVAQSGTLAAFQFDRFTRVLIGPSAFSSDGVAFGHATILDDDVDSIWDLIGSSLIAWAGESALDRIVRLSDEEGIPLRVVGNDSHTVGPQRIETFLDLIDSATEVDLGILSDDRDALRMLYRASRTLYNQPIALTLDYAAAQVAPPLEPVEDDQATRNDIVIKRTDGSSARAVLESGPLSIQPPPDGIGRYDESIDINVHSDGQLPHQAGWRLHLGTVDEARYPQITADLAAIPSLTIAATAVRAGDRIQITNPPNWLPPDTIDQLAQGGTEQLTPYRHTITYNTAPASPWSIGVIGGDVLGRADTLASRVSADVTSAATSIPVLTEAGPSWTVDGAQMPFDMRAGGEVMRVSAVADIRDTFTRSVSNGWGNATSGQVWSTSGGAAADYSVNGTRGLVSLGSVGVSRSTSLAVTARDIDVSMTVATDKVATGDWIFPSLLGRFIDASNFYRARLEMKHTGTIGITLTKVVAGVDTVLGSGVDIGSYAAGERFAVRLRIVGDEIKAKLWRAVKPEPDWTATATDTALTAAGAVGTRNLLGSANTNTLPVTLSWDDLTSKVQTFTVTRAQNGVIKNHGAGTALSLAQPATVAL